MMMLGFTEVLIFLLFGGVSNDIASLLEPQDYFNHRQIGVSVEKMLELAKTEPNSGKAQIQQLLALRVLAEDADKIKKAENFAAIKKDIRDIAEGKVAQDLQGFAAKYARKTLQAFGEKVESPAPVDDKGLVQETLNWFPKDCNFIASMGFPQQNNSQNESPFKKFLPLLPPEFKDKLYVTVEKIGNVQLDRASFGFLADAPNGDAGKIFVRMSGIGNHKRMVAMLKEANGANVEVEEIKNFRGRPITLIYSKNSPPCWAVVGDNDLIMCGESNNRGEHRKVVELVLDTRRGKIPSVIEGAYAKQLNSIPAKVDGLVVGELPDSMRREFTGPGSPLTVIPKTMAAYVVRNKKGDLKITMKADAANKNEAEQFVTGVNALKQMAIGFLQNPGAIPAQPQVGNIQKLIAEAQKTMESLEVKSDGKTVNGMMNVSGDLISEYSNMAANAFGMIRQQQVVPPAPAPQAQVQPGKVEERPVDDLPQARLRLPNDVVVPLTMTREVVTCSYEYKQRLSA